MYVLCTQLHLTLCNAMDCSPPGSLSMEFSRQEYWNGLSFPTSGDLPNPRIKPVSPVFPELAGGFFTTEPHIYPVNLSPTIIALTLEVFLD